VGKFRLFLEGRGGEGLLKFVTQKIQFCTGGGGVVCQNFGIQKFYSIQ
jgi:hypothetical protein